MTTIEICWRLRTPSGRILTCGLCCAETGIVVRASFGKHHELLSQAVSDVAIGRQIAARWRQALFDQGGFTGVAADEASQQVDHEDPVTYGGSDATGLLRCPVCTSTRVSLRSIQAPGHNTSLECQDCQRSWLQELTAAELRALKESA